MSTTVVIGAIEQDERRPDKYHVRLNDGRSVRLDEAIVVEERLSTGMRLDEADIARLIVAEEERALIDRAARFLAARPRSRAEVRRRLLRPNPRRATPKEEAVDRALDQLERLGYLDDAAFAAYWTEQRDRFSPRSARALQQELRQRGVGAETATASASAEDDEERAVAAGRKRLRSLAGADQQTFALRMSGFLQRRGFGYGVTRTAIRRLWVEAGASEEGAGDDPLEQSGDLFDDA